MGFHRVIWYRSWGTMWWPDDQSPECMAPKSDGNCLFAIDVEREAALVVAQLHDLQDDASSVTLGRATIARA